MHIFVQLLSGKMIPLAVEPYHTFEEVKQMIENQFGINACCQSYRLNGRLCLNECTLESFGFENGAFIHSVLHFTGGPHYHTPK